MDKEPLHILLADDDEEDRLLFQEALSELKMKTIVHTVNDGEQLMKRLTEENSTLPSLLFLDLNMPCKNGLECLKEIRSNKKLNNIAIAIYSTSSSKQDIDATFSGGANIYIEKPNDFNALKQALEKAISSTHSQEQFSFNRENFFLRI